MPLTPEDVRNKQFTTVRLREGYDEDEVDAFLDEVEAELTRLLRENEDLRAKLTAATRAAQQAQQPISPMRKDPGRTEMMPALSGAMPVSMAGPPQLAAPSMPASGGDSAARVLALAQQTADQAIAEARNEANKLVVDARGRADGMEREARSKADALERDAQEKHRVAMGALESARATLERKVEDLRAFEREYRSRLKSYLESQLRQLESQADESLAPPRPQAPSLPPSLTSPMAPVMSPAMASSLQPSLASQMPSQMPQMSPAMTQPMAPVRAPMHQNPPLQQATAPMRGFILEEDSGN